MLLFAQIAKNICLNLFADASFCNNCPSNLEILRGRDGRDGLPGVPGSAGLPGRDGADGSTQGGEAAAAQTHQEMS